MAGHANSTAKNIALYNRINDKLEELIGEKGEVLHNKFLRVSLAAYRFHVQRFASTKSFKVFIYSYKGQFVGTRFFKQWIEVVHFLKTQEI